MESLDIEQLKGMSNFEVAALFLENSEKNTMHNTSINVGRGNPNWINTRARLAFNKIVEFGIDESAKTIDEADGDMAGYVEKEGIAQRLHDYLDANDKTDKFILDFLAYTENNMHLNCQVKCNTNGLFL